MQAMRAILRTQSQQLRDEALGTLVGADVKAECALIWVYGSVADGVPPTGVFEIRVALKDYERASSALRPRAESR